MIMKKWCFEKYQEMRFYTLDINQKASETTKSTFLHNSLPNWKLEWITGDFNQNTLKTDILIFNPPYVPCSDEEMQKALDNKDDTAAWAGGYKGREVIDKLTPRIREFLTDTGVFYLLLIEVSSFTK